MACRLETRLVTQHLLISDLDNTLLGDDAALRRFVAWYEGRRQRLALVYSSGRSCASIEESLRAHPLPSPVAIVGGVGTEVWRFPSREPWPAWSERLSAGWAAERVDAVAREFADLEPQPAELCSPWKRSFFARDWSRERLGELRAALRAAEIRAEVVYSSRRDLDIVPAGANKGAAARFVAAELGYTAEAVLVSGDSGNDLAMFQCGFRGIVVGNAHRELCALESERVYRSPLAMADGVRDGLIHWLGE